ncbi:kinase-like domain-containing protein [Gilbertella persicaria]|uniref:kinase-like domain-containing protein n=1 Tax=Gilbertella persicaria TaxID=101096 RepID=UPI00221EE435|nr:kinase-like domain-containing protein [Gilbertella persicaria]KAI8087597.1 kinase-like domain-containing protein [Gilbertella persicaria]
MGNVDSIPENREKEEVQLSHFKIIKTLGKGAFGKVYKVQHIKRKELYALKVINKEQCIKMDAVKNIIRERTILECVDHPLVCNMRFAFQDSQSMFMAMDLMSGGDLRSHLVQDHNENVIKFWIAELVCAIKYLHSQGIVHRDIKPDNILLDQQGHVHLSDFNIACHIPEKNERPLTSLSGTAVYFAPEIFRGNGYNEDVDWWSLGITFYECVYGTRPWLHCTNIDELSKQVLHRNIPYPYKQSISPKCVSAIKCFLEKDSKKRMGHGVISGWKNIASHPFFQNIDWHKIDNKQCQPLYVPSLASEAIEDAIISDYLSNQNLMTVLNEPAASPPAEPNNDGVMGWLCRQKRRSSRTYEDNRHSQDLRLLEHRFKPFDYTIFEQYEGFLDEHLMTVGPPPDWVKPAFPGADNGTLLPVRQIYLDNTVFDVFQQENPYHKFHDTSTLNTAAYWANHTFMFEQQCK